MTNWLHAISFAISITLPNLLLLAFGFALYHYQQINDNFVNITSKLVFNYCLPCLLFMNIIQSDVQGGQQFNLILAGILVTFILYITAEIYAYFRITEMADKGVFVQGVFRSNMAIIGLATVVSAYGNAGIGIGAVYMGIITILYNILSVITLSRTQQQISRSAQIKDILWKIVSNPLIIALLSAFIYKAIHLPLPPKAILQTGHLLGNVSLPLALICAGASVNFHSMLSLSGLSMQASIARIIIAPIVAVGVGLSFQLSPLHMGILFMMVSAPVAAASYVMAKAMGGNQTLAANILAFTTVFSMIGMGIGAGILRSLHLI